MNKLELSEFRAEQLRERFTWARTQMLAAPGDAEAKGYEFRFAYMAGAYAAILDEVLRTVERYAPELLVDKPPKEREPLL